MLFFVEVPTANTWVFSPLSDQQTVPEVMAEALGDHYVTAELSPGVSGRPKLAVSYIEAHGVSGALDEWCNCAAETLALMVCDARDGPRVMDEFYGPVIFHAQTEVGPGWLTKTVVADLTRSAEQITSGHHVLDAPKPR